MTEDLEQCFLVDELEEPSYSYDIPYLLWDPTKLTEEDIRELLKPSRPGRIIRLSKPLSHFRTKMVRRQNHKNVLTHSSIP